MSSEFARIARLRTLLLRDSPQVMLNIGDDCAVLAPSPNPRVWTVDSAVEGVHFDRAFMRLQDIGYRAFMAATSDVAAMGGRAVAALSALTLPSDLDDAALMALIEGFAEASDACACPIIGGNLTRGRDLTVTTTVLGECTGKVLTRAGATRGEGVYLTGPVGGAALGLALASRGQPAALPAAVTAFLRPRARLDVAERIAALASCAIDVSDGFAQDLGHLCEASRVGARVDVAALPLLPGFEAAAARIAADPVALACAGGDDYELIFTSAREVDPALAARVGTITAAEDGVQLRDASGNAVRLSGFDHFARG